MTRSSAVALLILILLIAPAAAAEPAAPAVTVTGTAYCANQKVALGWTATSVQPFRVDVRFLAEDTDWKTSQPPYLLVTGTLHSSEHRLSALWTEARFDTKILTSSGWVDQPPQVRDFPPMECLTYQDYVPLYLSLKWQPHYQP